MAGDYEASMSNADVEEEYDRGWRAGPVGAFLGLGWKFFAAWLLFGVGAASGADSLPIALGTFLLMGGVLWGVRNLWSAF